MMAFLFAPKFARDLEVGEILVWTGQPDREQILNGQDVLWIPCGCVMNILVVPFALGFIFASHHLLVIIMGLGMLVSSLYVLFGRLVYKKWRRERTYYGLTNRRALVLTESQPRQLQTLVLADAPPWEKQRKMAGKGSIVFKTTKTSPFLYDNGLDPMLGQKHPAPFAFMDIPEVDNVERMIAFIWQDTKRD